MQAKTASSKPVQKQISSGVPVKVFTLKVSQCHGKMTDDQASKQFFKDIGYENPATGDSFIGALETLDEISDYIPNVKSLVKLGVKTLGKTIVKKEVKAALKSEVKDEIKDQVEDAIVTEAAEQLDIPKELVSKIYNRVKPRKGTLAQVEKNQPRNSAGEMIDPYTKKPLKVGKTDLGHKPGQEWRKRTKMHQGKGSTRKAVLETENDPDLYQYEDRSGNRSHKNEKKD
jgi:hypothetical protein